MNRLLKALAVREKGNVRAIETFALDAKDDPLSALRYSGAAFAAIAENQVLKEVADSFARGQSVEQVVSDIKNEIVGYILSGATNFGSDSSPERIYRLKAMAKIVDMMEKYSDWPGHYTEEDN